MKSLARRSTRILVATVLAAVTASGLAQTPAQLEYERQQREYWRQQEQQRQEQQRQQQLMQDNARRQQEESSRINAPAGQAPGGASPGAAPGGGGDPSGAQAAAAARAMWEKRPALPPERNPLLGKWSRPASTRANPSDPFGQIVAMAKGGLCEVLFGGGGVFEFRPDRLVGMDERTRAQELDRVEYRGDAKHVVVLPKTTLKLMEFDVEGPDRVNWAAAKCVLVRVGAPSASASASTATAAVPAGAAAAASARPASSAGGVLAMSVVALSSEHKIAGRKLWVLKEDAQVALIKGGLKSTPDGSVLQNWVRACVNRTPDCEKGARALQAFSVGIATTDAGGHAQTPLLPAGRYWVFSDTKVGDKRLMWNEPVDLKAGEKSVTLAKANALPVE